MMGVYPDKYYCDTLLIYYIMYPKKSSLGAKRNWKNNVYMLLKTVCMKTIKLNLRHVLFWLLVYCNSTTVILWCIWEYFISKYTVYVCTSIRLFELFQRELHLFYVCLVAFIHQNKHKKIPQNFMRIMIYAVVHTLILWLMFRSRLYDVCTLLYINLKTTEKFHQTLCNTVPYTYVDPHQMMSDGSSFEQQ